MINPHRLRGGAVIEGSEIAGVCRRDTDGVPLVRGRAWIAVPCAGVAWATGGAVCTRGTAFCGGMLFGPVWTLLFCGG